MMKALSIFRRFCILIGCFLSSRVPTKAHPPITHIGIEQGLSNNSVRCIFQDHNGFMWFGTYDGLNRYDGYGFTVFRNKLNDPTSLPHNYIFTISEDNQHNIWVGTGQGAGVYNSLTARFASVWFYPYGSGQPEQMNFNVTAIKSDSGGDIFIGSNGWGLHVRSVHAAIAHQVPFNRGGIFQTHYNVQGIAIDGQQRVWLFIDGAGLCLYDKKTGGIRLVNTGLNNINCMEADNVGNLWLGTAKGLYRYSVATGILVPAYNKDGGTLSADDIACLTFDKKGRLWIGTRGSGLHIINTATGRIDHLLPGEGKNDLSSESVCAVYEDNESRQWIGTIKGGINIIDPQNQRFQTISHNPANPNSLINNSVSAFFEDHARNLWIGTDGGGMSIWDRQSDRFTNFRHQPGNPASLSHNYVSSILQDYLGEIWISTFGGGINRFNKQSATFTHFACVNDLTGDENKNVWLLYEDHDHNLWATTFGDGKLYKFNRRQGRFVMFDQAFTDLVSITGDKNGALWAGDCHRSLFKIDKQDKLHRRYNIGKPVRALYEDHKGRFWIGTEGGGLILFDRAAGRIVTRYSDANGLCNNSILNILEDKQGFLWVSTFNGLARFDVDHKIFKNFYQADGLQSNQFLYSAALKLQSGELAFGGIKGFNLFSPDSIRPRAFMPPLMLTGLRVDNKQVMLNDPYITRTNEDKITALRIPYNKAIVSFDFAALEYSSPANITYAYRLEGWDQDWNHTKDVRTVNYTNLTDGSYRLRIRSTNAEGAWNDRETSLDIVVLPPFYRSPWAYLVYAVVIIALIYYYRRYKARQTRLEYEIKVAHLYAEKEKEINEKRLSFFTSISHEFRTPLTLIINPLKDILRKNTVTSEEDHQEIKIVFRNARRLLSLVDQLLLFRKAESDGDRLRITKLNFHDLCKEVYLAFLQKARAEGIDYSFDGGNTDMEIYADREKMEIVFYNLLSNALKYTPSGGSISFRIKETEEKVDVIVSDSGRGIPPETGEKLFEKFYQVLENGGPSKTGFGIGLYLVKQFVESHKGTITYESETGTGTSFCVSLKKGRAHLDTLPLFEDVSARPVLLEELTGSESEPAVSDTHPDNDVRQAEWVSGRRSLLIVDDNEQIREYITRLFHQQYTVYQASSGEEGLDLARRYQPDIVISDIVMQTMTGIDLCRNIKQDLCLGHTPVILLTGNPSQETELQGAEGGADDYISKPFDKEILLARVASLLKNRNRLQQYFYNEVTLQKNNLKISEDDKLFIDRCIGVVKDHLDDDEFMIKTLALEMGMSHSSLYKKIKSVSGQSVNGFVRFIRLRRAAELLISTEKNVNEVALEAGFNDMKYFREQFHKLFGMMPSEYIRKFRPAFSKNIHVNRGSRNREGI